MITSLRGLFPMCYKRCLLSIRTVFKIYCILDRLSGSRLTTDKDLKQEEINFVDHKLNLII